MLQHLGAPIFVDHTEIFKIELLDDEDGQFVVSELEQLLDDVLSLVMLELLISYRSGKVHRISHLSEYNGVFDNINISTRVEIGRIAEFFGKTSRGQQMLQNVNIMVLLLGSLQ